MNNSYGIGLMSGTSLDGIDVVYCRFTSTPTSFEIISAHTFPYPCGWRERLKAALTLNAAELYQLDIELGAYFGDIVRSFISAYKLKDIDFVASHGHTVFHQPDQGLTLQVGHPANLAIHSGQKVVADFRSADVFLGGQGAPLVPVGDRDLFGQYNYRLNIGGFANVSYETQNTTLAYDLCPANIVLNDLIAEKGQNFDENGEVARKGRLNEELMAELSGLPYFTKKPPKSLGKEWFDNEFMAIINGFEIPVQDKLRTVTELISFEIGSKLLTGTTLVTGGGAHNVFLMERIKHFTKSQLIIPDKKLVDFKEGLIFAYLGFLRLQGKTNTLKSVTGASKNHSSGGIYLP